MSNLAIITTEGDYQMVNKILNKGETQLYDNINPQSAPIISVEAGAVKAELFELPNKLKAIESNDIYAGHSYQFTKLSKNNTNYLIIVTGIEDFENNFSSENFV